MTHLFITGTQDSGTNELRDILNADKRIAIGAGRFQSHAWKNWSLTQDLYEAERFFDTTADLEIDAKVFGSNSELYDEMADRFDSCTYVGDALPMAFLQIDKLAENFPGAKVVMVLRNPYDVLASAERRARNSGRSESTQFTDTAFAAWVRLIGLARPETQPSGLDFHFVLHERLLLEGQGLDELYAFLGLDPDPAVAASLEAVTDRVRNEQQEVADLASQYSTAQIANFPAIDVYRKICRELAGNAT